MKTDDLIRSLAADQGWHETPVAQALWRALLVALPVAAVVFYVELGLRPDFMQALRSFFFDLKFVVTGALVAAAFVFALELTRPESPAARRWLLLAPLVILFAGIALDLAIQTSPMRTRMIGTNALLCLSSIPLLSLPFLVAAFAALRRGASTRPGLSGAVAGLMAGGLGATLYAAHCVDDSPLFVAVWYSLAIGVVAIVGALAGQRWLRF
jgi:hypothetical protein